MKTITAQFNHLTRNWKKITSLLVVGSLLFGTIVPPIAFAADFSLKKGDLCPRDQIRSVSLYQSEAGEGKRKKERRMDKEEGRSSYLRVLDLKEPVSFQREEIRSDSHRKAENQRLRKESGFREGGRLASESRVLALAAPYIPVDQFSKVSHTFSKQVKEQIYRNRLISEPSSQKRLAKGQSSPTLNSASQIIANQVSHFVSRVSALHAGKILKQAVMIIRNRDIHALDISDDEFENLQGKLDKEFVSIYLEKYFTKYRVKGFEEMTDEEIKEGRKPLTEEEMELMKEIELEFEKQANTNFRYVGITRVKVALWEGPGMVESEDVWMLAPLFITDTSEPRDSKYVPYHWVRNETGRSFINRGIIKKWLEIKNKYGKEAMIESIKVYVVRELGAQVIMDMQGGINPERIILGGETLKKQNKDIDDIGKEELRRRVEKIGSREGFDLAHLIVQGNEIEALRLLLNHLEIGFTDSGFSSEINYTLRWGEGKWYKYASLALAIIEGWSLDHKGLMDLGRRVANDIRLGDFADYVYVRDLVDTMLEVDVISHINPLGLFGEFLGEIYESVRDGKNGVGDYAKALNDIFNLIKRNKEFYLQYKELMEKVLRLLNEKGKNWKEIGLHKIIPIPGDEESLKPLMELIRELEKGNDNSQGIVKVVGTVLIVLSSVLIGQEVLANGLVPAISSGLSFIDIAPLITGGAGFQLLSGNFNKLQENQRNYSSDVVDPYIARTAQFLGDSELVKALFSFYQSVMSSIEEQGIRFIANIQDLKENPAKLAELENFVKEAEKTENKSRPYQIIIVTDKDKIMTIQEVEEFLKEHQLDSPQIQTIHYPLVNDRFDLKGLIEKLKEDKLMGDGYALRVINSRYWLILKEFLKNISLINGLELLELDLRSMESTNESA